MRQNALIGSVRSYLDGLVHPAATVDPIEFVRHRAFIATRLMPGLLAFSALPLYLALQGVPGTLEAITFGWLLLPIAIAFYLSRTGRYETAHLFSAAALTGIVALVAALSGGTSSFVVIWFALVPAEAVLSGSRRVVAAAGAMVVGAVSVIGLSGMWNFLPDPRISPLGAELAAFVSVTSAVIYGLGLALSAAIVSRTGEEVQSVSERRYRLLAEHMSDLITRHGRSGAVTFASPASERVAGVPPFALHGQGLFDRVHIADRPAYLNALSLASARGTATSAEFRLRRMRAETNEPTFVWVEMRCHPLGGASTEDHQVVSVLRDVSERKSHEAAVDSARTEADRANEARGRFLANVSHELRTPLNAIIGFSEMLLHQELTGTLSPKQADQVGMIRQAGTHLLEVVNSILDVSKIESGCYRISPEPFVLKDTVALCCAMVTPQAQAKNVSLAARVADNVGEISCDQRAVQQILLNLLSNAIKFTPHDGRIRVAACRDGELVKLRVSDNGIGIAQPDLARIGQPFMQVHNDYTRQYQGTGLGLSLVKGLVTLHGGSLSIESAPGLGTHVTVALPVKCDGAEHDGPAGWEVHAPHDNERMTTKNGAPILKIA